MLFKTYKYKSLISTYNVDVILSDEGLSAWGLNKRDRIKKKARASYFI